MPSGSHAPSNSTTSTASASTANEAGCDAWRCCVDQLAQELPQELFQTWIKPLSARVADDLSKVTIFVANRFKLDWIRVQYSPRMAVLMERLTGQPVQIELALLTRETTRETKARVPDKVVPVVAENSDKASVANTVRRPALPQHRLNAALTFDTLVEGSANRMARAAALHVAGMPGSGYLQRRPQLQSAV